MNLSNPFSFVDTSDINSGAMFENSLYLQPHPLTAAYATTLKRGPSLYPTAADFLKQHIPSPLHIPTASTKNAQQPPIFPTNKSGNKRTRSPSVQPVMSPLGVDTINHLIQEQNLKKRRLARKAELARLSRRRKKERLDVLEKENVTLMAEIDRLRQQHQRDQDLIKAQAQQLQGMSWSRTSRTQSSTMPSQEPYLDKAVGSVVQNMVDDMICFDRVGSSGSLSSFDSSPDCSPPSTPNWDPDTPDVSPSSPVLEIFPELPEFKKQPLHQIPGLRPTPQSVQGTIGILKSHLQATEAYNAGIPNTTPVEVKFLKWVFSQKQKFYDAKDGLWCALFEEELACSPGQLFRLQKLCGNADADQNVELEQLFQKLKAAILAQDDMRQANVLELQAVLSKSQVKTLATWIKRFGSVCVKINI